MKSGIDYFPLDVVSDAKLELIEAEFGLIGFGVIVHLLQEIYGRAGYYIEWTEEVALLFARKIGLGGSVVSEIIEASIRRSMFDKEKYDKYRVLTSKEIQTRYFEAVSRRKVLKVDYNILLIDCTHFFKNVSIQAENVNIFSKNAYIEKQSKEKERKEKESKLSHYVRKACTEQQGSSAPPAAALPLNDGSFYEITAEQVDRWKALYPAVDVMQELRKMTGWCDSHPKRRKTRKGVKAFVTAWLAREQDKGGACRNEAPPPSGKRPQVPACDGKVGALGRAAIAKLLEEESNATD